MQNEYINAERSEARELRKAWVELDDKRQELERDLNEARRQAEKWRDAHASYYHAPKPKLPWENAKRLAHADENLTDHER